MLTTTLHIDPPVEVACPPARKPPLPSVDAMRNIRVMHLLERIASGFNEAGIELMVLSGAAMTLLLDLEPGGRPIRGLDLMVRPETFHAATRLLEDLGSLRDEVVFREDLYPKYHHAMQFTAGRLAPVLVTLHARPFRPLRYARLVPDDASTRFGPGIVPNRSPTRSA